ncbi:hypothetical protein HC028_08270 [Planosporangium flavigriseum]|uniref:Uncharacterized protein n=1 Tax=Planosporangium flavigriseum TaxID=373681 RepID=A0A8J3LQT5_9ACTN|nr:hypothetical protein [Planosporangium flavigriseum]NJC64501.1 hypothetical protein [Planosporangium flavigriseum]GIG72021.1 hypothetical protein Pfl04_04250 [Planosporangium flavigriseum]
MGYRDKGDRSRERRDRRPPLANWSSAAEFGDATIDRPTPLTGRRDRGGRQADGPAARTRSDAAGWATIAPVEDQRDDGYPASRRYSDDEFGAEADSRPWSTSSTSYDSEPSRSYGITSRGGYDSRSRPADEPRRSGRGVEENPRRSRRALEESARRAVEELARRVQDEQPGLLGILDDDAGPRGLPAGYEDDSLGRASNSEASSPRDWRASEPRSRHYRDESHTGSWRARQTTEFETWRSESTQTWRSRETIEVDPSDIRTVGPRAIGSNESSTAAYARPAEPAGLEAWPTETGTWRTGDTATTGSWRVPQELKDVGAQGGDTGGWRTGITPEAGSWSRSRGRWIPSTDDTGEQPNFTVRRYEDTGEIPKDLLEAARDRILDHEALYDSGRHSVTSDRRGDDSGEWRAGSRRAVDADRFADPARDRSDEEPRQRSRYPRYDDDAPRYRAGRRSTSGSRAGRPAPDGYDDDEQRPTRAVVRRAPAYAGPRTAVDNVITPRASAGRGELVRVGRRMTAPDDDDDVEEVAYGYAGAGAATVAWFGLPIGAFLLWAMFLGGAARADCVDANGGPCPTPRDAAFATFAAHLPQVGVAIVLSVLVALLIRLATPFWRPATVGFAAAVVGGGVATVLFTVLNST